MTERPSPLALAASMPEEPRDPPEFPVTVKYEGLPAVHPEARRYGDLQRLTRWLTASPTIRSQIHDAVDAALDELEEPAP